MQGVIIMCGNRNSVEAAIDSRKRVQEEAHETKVRKIMGELGYKIMHRRNGEYWIMSDTPKTLDQIEAWIERQSASK
jgi:hypothetical protein